MNFNHLANAIVPQATSAFSIPVKICDGLFMADHYIAQDSQFFQTNLITHVINCAGQEVQNSHKVSGVAFLTFDWTEKNVQIITEQKVVSVTVNFIEECRKEAGCLLINYCNSQSRPFCLLACYFMVRFKWSLFKTLQFLNSRKQDVELQPAFFQQLTAFAQKLQDKGLIRSKTWVLSNGMSDQEIIITNTYLNSKNKFPPAQASVGKNRNKNKNSVTWKKDLVQEHNYCPNSVICQKNQKQQKEKERQSIQKQEKQQRKSLIQPPKNAQKVPINISRQKRQDSLKKSQKQPQSQPQLQPHRPNIIQQQKQKAIISTSMTEMNVTRKWAQLRQMWLREKENHNSSLGNKEVSQKQQTPIIVKKDGQRINDRLQEKLNMLKRHQQKAQLEASTRPSNKKDTSQIMQERQSNVNSHTNTIQQQKPQERVHQKHHYNHQPHLNSNNNPNNLESNSRIMHNNWIIDNQMVGDLSGHRNSKNKLHANPVAPNKSVIIVKPNHGSSSLDNKNAQKMRDSSLFNTNNHTVVAIQPSSNHASRSSLRKVAGSERKQQNNSSLNKENINSTAVTTTKFFRNEATDIITTKGRCSSAKPQRKENVNSAALGLGLTKNGSLKGKGKWKF